MAVSNAILLQKLLENGMSTTKIRSMMNGKTSPNKVLIQCMCSQINDCNLREIAKIARLNGL